MSLIEFKNVRKHNRFKPSEDIEIYISVSSSFYKGSRIKARLKDISETGMGIFAVNDLDADESIMIDMFFGKTRITTSAMSVYSIELDDGFAIGIKLDESAEPIMEFIKARGIDLIKV